MFGGFGQEYRRAHGGDPSATPPRLATPPTPAPQRTSAFVAPSAIQPAPQGTSPFVAPSATPPTPAPQRTSAFVAPSATSPRPATPPMSAPQRTSAFVAPPQRTNAFVAPPNRREDCAAASKDEEASPESKRARLCNRDEWTKYWLSKQEINFAKHPVCILGRRYPLTKTAYKYIDVAVVVKPESYVDIALGDCHGKEVSLTIEMWREFIALRGDIMLYFEDESNGEMQKGACAAIGNAFVRFGKINNMKTLRFESGRSRIALSHSTIKTLFAVELCVDRLVTSFTGLLEAIDATLSRTLAISRIRFVCTNTSSRTV